MSLHFTVTGNPIYFDRGKILLADRDTYKKNLFDQRRKIRLQQARQQAKDFSRKFRQKVCKGEDKLNEREREKTTTTQKQETEARVKYLEQELEECITQVGSAHRLASLQEECEELLRERQELRNEIARARGTVAQERVKADKCLQKDKVTSLAGRKQMMRKVEDLRATLVSNLPPSKPQSSGVKRTVRVQVHRGADEDNGKIGHLPQGRSWNSRRSNHRSDVSNKTSSESHQSNRLKGALSDCEELEEESDNDSDVTWPPRSARVVKEPIPSPRVRLYDHNTRLSKECSSRPLYKVTPVNPIAQQDMGEEIANEEADIVRKENLEFLARRDNLIRGNKALRKERDKKEAEIILKEIDEIEKRRRIQTAVTKSYPSHFHARGVKRVQFKETDVISGSQRECPCEDNDESQTATVSKESIPDEKEYSCTSQEEPQGHVTKREDFPPNLQFEPTACKEGTEELLEDLICKLKEERARKQRQLESRFGVPDLKEEDIPIWMSEKNKEKKDSDVNHSFDSQSRWCSILNESIQEERRRSYEERKNRNDEQTRRSPDIHCAERSDNQTPQGSPQHISGKKVKSSPVGQKRITEEKDSIITEPKKSKRQARQKLPFTKQCSCSIDCACTENLLEESSLEDMTGKCSSENGSPERMRSREDPVEVSFERDSPPTKDSISTCSETSSQQDTLRSSLSYEGVKVVVRVSDRNKTKKSKSPVKVKISDKDVQTSTQEVNSKNMSRVSNTNNEGTSSSTSYRSLPSNLSPEHQALLSNLLAQVGARTKNPRLNEYINRLLCMTQESIDNLLVSSVSDVSIPSSAFGPPEKFESIEQGVKKYDESCQANNSIDDAYKEEVLNFTELAKCYAHRVEDLAGMLECLNLVPSRRRQEQPDDTSYMRLPKDMDISPLMSESVVHGRYPSPPNISDLPTSIQPHPSTWQPPLSSTSRNGFLRRGVDENKRNNGLFTIEEADSICDRGLTESPKLFDANVSSIKGSPGRKTSDFGEMNTTSSSLCLLDEKDVSPLLGSSSDDVEDVFRSLGIGWALPTVRKVWESRKLSSSSSSGGRAHYSHSTPLVQSPVRPSPSKTRRSSLKTSRSPPSSGRTGQPPSTSTSRAALPLPLHRQGPAVVTHFYDTDSLTPPSYTLNIPHLTLSPHRKYS